MPLVESSLRNRVSKKAIQTIVRDIRDYTDKESEREKAVAYAVWEILNGVYDPLDTNDRIRAYGVITEILLDYFYMIGQPKEMQALAARFHESATKE